MHGTPLIHLADVSKVYHLDSGDFTALNHISLDINEANLLRSWDPQVPVNRP
jgi:putative ABC transport system ATP-binding protein